MKSKLPLLLALASLAVMSAQRTRPRVVDLGHPIQAGDPSWDPKPSYRRESTATIEKDG